LGGSYSNNSQIAPFILNINGILKKENYYWKWENDSTTIEVEFPENVPGFGFKKTSFWERNIVESIKVKIAQILKFSTMFGGNIFDSFTVEQKKQIQKSEELSNIAESIIETEEVIGETEDIEETTKQDVNDEGFQERINELKQTNQQHRGVGMSLEYY